MKQNAITLSVWCALCGVGLYPVGAYSAGVFDGYTSSEYNSNNLDSSHYGIREKSNQQKDSTLRNHLLTVTGGGYFAFMQHCITLTV